VRREGFDEGVDEAAQVGVAQDADARGVRFDQMPQVAADEVGVGRRVEGHFRQNPHAQPHAHVGLDDIRVDRREHHLWLEGAPEKSLVDVIAPGEGAVVGDDGMAGDRLQGERLQRGEFVAFGHDQRVRPLVAG